MDSGIEQERKKRKDNNISVKKGSVCDRHQLIVKNTSNRF